MSSEERKTCSENGDWASPNGDIWPQSKRKNSSEEGN